MAELYSPPGGAQLYDGPAIDPTTPEDTSYPDQVTRSVVNGSAKAPDYQDQVSRSEDFRVGQEEDALALAARRGSYAARKYEVNDNLQSRLTGALSRGWQSFTDLPDQIKLSEANDAVAKFQKQHTPEELQSNPEYQEWSKLAKETEARLRDSASKSAEQYPTSDSTDLARSGGKFQTKDWFQKLKNLGNAVAQDPVGIIAETAVESTPASLAMAATALMARFGFGSSAASVAGGGLASSLQDFGSSYAGKYLETGDHETAYRDALVHASIVGVLDAAAIKSAGGALDAAVSKSGVLAKVKEGVKETGRQAGLGASGEAGGSLAAGNIPEPYDVFAEAAGEVGQGIATAPTAASRLTMDKLRGRGQPVTPPGAVPPGATPTAEQTLAAAQAPNPAPDSTQSPPGAPPPAGAALAPDSTGVNPLTLEPVQSANIPAQSAPNSENTSTPAQAEVAQKAAALAEVVANPSPAPAAGEQTASQIALDPANPMAAIEAIAAAPITQVGESTTTPAGLDDQAHQQSAGDLAAMMLHLDQIKQQAAVTPPAERQAVLDQAQAIHDEAKNHLAQYANTHGIEAARHLHGIASQTFTALKGTYKAPVQPTAASKETGQPAKTDTTTAAASRSPFAPDFPGQTLVEKLKANQERDAIQGTATRVPDAPESGTTVPESGTPAAGPLDAQTDHQETKPATKAQVLAGNAPLDHIKVGPFNISVENKAGTTRQDLKNEPPQWSTKMVDDYGYAKGVSGADEEVDGAGNVTKRNNLDFFVKKGTPANFSGDVYVIDQKNQDGEFDEHKVMAGYGSLEEAKAAYLAHYPKGWDGIQAITPISIGRLHDWAQRGNTKIPFASQAGGYGTTGRKLKESVYRSVKLGEKHPAQAKGLISREAEGAVLRNPSVAFMNSELKRLYPGMRPLNAIERKAMRGVLRDIEALGFNTKIFGDVAGFVTYDGQNSSTAFHAVLAKDGLPSRIVGISEEYLNATDDYKRAKAVGDIIHELSHSADYHAAHGFASTQAGSRVAFSNDGGMISASGDVAAEAYDVYRTTLDEQLYDYLAYPLNELVMQNDTSDENTGRAAKELFAQLRALWYTDPVKMKRDLPLAYKLFQEIHDATKSNSLIAEDNDAVRASLRGGRSSSVQSGLEHAGSAGTNAAGIAGREAGRGMEGSSRSQEVSPPERGTDSERVVVSNQNGDALDVRKKETVLKANANVEDVARHFDAVIKKEFGGPLDINNPEHVARAIKIARKEFAYQLTQAKSGLDWYSGDIKTAYALTAKVIPELGEEIHRQMFSVVAAIMSPESKAHENWDKAAVAYQHYVRDGRIPEVNPESGEKWGPKTGSIKAQALGHLNSMIEDMGHDAATAWLLSEHPVSELNAMKTKYGAYKGGGVEGKRDEMRLGVYIFGPKVGPFTLNINGIDTEVTVDKWLTRTINRYFGTMFHNGKMQDAPTEPQRRVIKEIVRDVAAKEGYSPSQVQAVLWFFEQQTYNTLGAGSKSYAFSDGAKLFLDGHGVDHSIPESGANTSGERASGAAPEKREDGRAAGAASATHVNFTRQGALIGLPASSPGALPVAKEAAERYMKKAGLPYNPPTQFVKVDPAMGKRIADAYEAMVHDPENPEVKAAYRAMIRETIAQWHAIAKTGMKFSFSSAENPYPYKLPQEVYADVRDNNHMSVYSTQDDSFGGNESQGIDVSDNPLLAKTNIVVDGKTLLANDVFRAVHDYFGHVKDGAGFRANGEENAWRSHSAMYSPLARKAMTSETRGQNSWVNWGPFGETNRTASQEDTEYATQKTGLLPDWVVEDSYEKTGANTIVNETRPQESTDAFKKWFGNSKVVDDQGRPLVVYHGTAGDFDAFDGATTGSRHADLEVGSAFFFSDDASTANWYAKSAGKRQGGANVRPVYLSLRNPLDVDFQGTGLETLAEDIARAKASGRDGLIARNYDDGKVSTHYIAFKPTQVKSATGNSGAFSARSPIINNSEAKPLWYSSLKKSLDEKAPFAKDGTAPAKQLALWLDARSKDGTISGRELQWTGLDDYLKLKDGKVTRDEVNAFLDQNGVKVTEKMLGESSYDVEAWWNDEGGANAETPYSDLNEDERSGVQDRYDDEVGRYEENATKYHDRVLPGGKNYRELLLTLPPASIDAVPTRKQFQLIDSNGDAIAAGDQTAKDRWLRTEKVFSGEHTIVEKQVEDEQGIQRAHQKAGAFISPHFDGHPNILAHVRFNERTDANGKKVLFIEEIQSDWAQKGRKEGFSSAEDSSKWTAEPVRVGFWRVSKPDGTLVKDNVMAPTADVAIQSASNKISGIPNAPFVGKTEAWVALAMKRMIRYAADNGFDRVAWTNGEQQAARYDLSKQINSISSVRVGPAVDAWKIRIMDKGGQPHKLGTFTAAELPDAVGKEMAAKIVKADAGGEWHGLDLKVGGEGMKSFYDKIVPNVANDVLKKLGGGRVTDIGPLVERGISGQRYEGPTILKGEIRDWPTRGDWTAEMKRQARDVFNLMDNGVTFQQAMESHASTTLAEEFGGRMEQDERTGSQQGFDITPEMLPRAREPMVLNASMSKRDFGNLTTDQETALENVGGIVKGLTIADRYKALTSNWRVRAKQGLIDQFAGLKDLDPKAYLLARLSKASDGALEAMMVYGNLQLLDGVTDTTVGQTNGIIAVLQKLQGEHHRFLWWIAAHRAEALSAVDKEHLFGKTDIDALKTLNLGNMPDGTSRQAAYLRALTEYNRASRNILDIAEQSGIIDPESRATWEKQFYVPFYRAMEDGVSGPNIGRASGLVRQYAFKKLKGGSQKLHQDLLANVLMNWSHLLSASAKNRAAVAALDAAEAQGDATQVPNDTKGAVFALKNGQKVSYEVHDPIYLSAITALEAGMLGGAAGKVLSKFKNALTIGVTANPAFKVRNLIRDSVAALAQSELSYNVAGNVYGGVKEMASKKSQVRASLLAGGGLIRFGAMLDGNRSSHVDKLVKAGVPRNTIVDTRERLADMVQVAWDHYNEIGDISEGANRASLYKQLRAKGMSHAEASLQARDLLDFSKQGAWPAVRFLVQTVPFMNARLQGLAKLYDEAKVRPGRMAAVIGAVALASIALMLAYNDDDDWKKREDWDRDNYWWFKIGDTAYRIPKPFEVGAIATLAERGIEMFVSDEMTQKRMWERVKFALTQTFMMNPVPQMFKPIIDIYSNKDSFTGRPIESAGQEALPKSERIGHSTSEVAKLAGNEALSPEQIDHLVRGYFGWLGTATFAAADAALAPFQDRPPKASATLKDAFLVGNFAESLPSSQSRYVTEFYDQAKEINEAYASYRNKVKLGDREGALAQKVEQGHLLSKEPQVAAAQRKLADINAQTKKIEADHEMDPDTKRTKLNILATRRNAITERVVHAIED